MYPQTDWILLEVQGNKNDHDHLEEKGKDFFGFLQSGID